MFNRKNKKVEVPTIETRTITVPTAHGLKDMIAPTVATAAELVKERTSEAAHTAGEWAKPHLEQGRELAETQATNAKGLLDDASPKLSALLASGTAAKEEALSRSHDAALVLRGDATIKRKKTRRIGGVLSTLGVLAVLGAFAAYVAQRLSQPKDDPWARPLTDPYIAPAEGRDTTVAAGEGVEVAQVSEVADLDATTATDVEVTPSSDLAEGETAIEEPKN